MLGSAKASRTLCRDGEAQILERRIRLGPVAELFRSFDLVFCRKGDTTWHHHNSPPRNLQHRRTWSVSLPSFDVKPYAAGGEGGPKKGHPVLCGAKQMRFAFIAENKHVLPVNHLCEIMDVSPRGYRAYCARPLSNGPRKDLVVLAHFR